MQADIKETLNLLRAALLIAKHGEESDLEREEIAALAAVINVAHTTASTLTEGFKEAFGQVEG